MDPGESSVQAAVRELAEETDMDVAEHHLQLVDTCVNNFADQGVEWVTILYRLVLRDRFLSVRNCEPDKKVGTSWTWVRKDRLPYPLFKPLEHLQLTGVLDRILTR